MGIGRAAAMVLTEHTNRKPKFLIGMDTRASSQMLEASISAGLCSVGADVMLLGEVPTPAVAYLVRKYEYDAAIMISASHNPCEYNGIKIFDEYGFKLSDETEEEIEHLIKNPNLIPAADPLQIGTILPQTEGAKDYINHLKSP
jgi:phosphoglucosamine mutase